MYDKHYKNSKEYCTFAVFGLATVLTVQGNFTKVVYARVYDR